MYIHVFENIAQQRRFCNTIYIDKSYSIIHAKSCFAEGSFRAGMFIFDPHLTSSSQPLNDLQIYNRMESLDDRLAGRRTVG